MAKTPLSHLHPTTRPVAALDRNTRVLALQRDRWIDYPRAGEALQRLARLLNTPERERMPCMVMHGPSNIGKTLIIAKFLRDHLRSFDLDRGIERRPVVALQMPPTPDQGRFYRALLFEVGAPQSGTATQATVEQLARDILRRIGPRMLVVDEVHHLLAGSQREQRASLNLLKYLANDLKICVVAVGTSDVPVAFQRDAQTSSRFTPFEIPRWSESDDFRRLLRAFEETLPLRRASDLEQRPIGQFLIAASGGLLGEVSRLLSSAAEQAIRDGTEQFTLQRLERTAHAFA